MHQFTKWVRGLGRTNQTVEQLVDEYQARMEQASKQFGRADSATEMWFFQMEFDKAAAISDVLLRTRGV